ncbi:TonB-dependent receptor plug domain-containing protein [Enhygromyxa salina]|uniref:Vitamin B12 transporter BtuB n=1 Tax=Enhygromyxa salina TaxID=215803 RepID=A0A2S9YY87_9BACT|nr:TonB-dependent receptor [Enhygromyxa salina]PRQ10053.1 Vitamin B12 transporter BtuB precursor [Enhygromyxa salina]
MWGTLAIGLALALAPPRNPAPEPPPPEPYRTEVVVGREQGDGLAAQRALSRRNVGFVTAIDLEAEPGQRPADDLAGVVSRAPGVTVRSLGGLGQFSAITIRGSTSQQVPVFLDGAPLTGSLSGLVDLSTQPLDALARVELYRGYVPIRYGAAAIGGAMDLVGAVHQGSPKLWVASGFGSYLAREARLGYTGALSRRLSLATRVGYAGSRGDFRYFDDGGTPLLSTDDAIRRRVNNGYDRLFGQVRLDARRGPLRVSSQLLGWWKLQGVPGTASAPSADASQRVIAVRSITRARMQLGSRAGVPGHVEWIASAALEDRVFRDLGGQVGLAADDEHARSFDGWLSPRLRVPLWPMAWLELVAELRGEWIEIDERFGDDGDNPGDPLASGDATRSRFSAAAGAEIEQWLFERRWSIAAGIRVDLADSHFAVPPGAGELDDQGADEVALGVSPRVGTKLVLTEGLDLRGSVGRYLRFPNLGELFGDRGYVVGNEGLLPERGTKLDGGVVLDLEQIGGRELGLFAQVVGFATWSEDLIQWVRSGPVVRPINVVGARVRGLEAGFGIRGFGRDLSLDLTYTLLDTRNDTPEAEQQFKPLPGRPRHSALARPALGHRFTAGPSGVELEPRLFYELEWIAGNFLDLSGRVELPARALHAAGISLRIADRVELAIEGRNLSNRLRAVIDPAFGPPTPYPAAISDFIGFPLPGLSVWGTVRVDVMPGPRHETSR